MVKLATFLTLSWVISLVAAAPAESYGSLLLKRDDNSDNNAILNFALTLEHLESEFYKEGLRKFSVRDFENAGAADPELARRTFQEIGKDEATHVTTLQTVIKSLGGNPVPPCKFNFDAAMKDVNSFIGTARALEVTGVSAYTGALAALKTAAIQTAGGTIGTVEARHATFLNLVAGGSPIPYAFDTPLSAANVFTIATPFIRSCGNVNLGIKAHNALKITNKSVRQGTRLNLQSDKLGSRSGLFCNFLFAEKSIITPLSDCRVPKDVEGFGYVVVLDKNKGLGSGEENSSIRAGPAIFFADSDEFRSSRGSRGSRDRGGRSQDDEYDDCDDESDDDRDYRDGSDDRDDDRYYDSEDEYDDGRYDDREDDRGSRSESDSDSGRKSSSKSGSKSSKSSGDKKSSSKSSGDKKSSSSKSSGDKKGSSSKSDPKSSSKPSDSGSSSSSSDKSSDSSPGSVSGFVNDPTKGWTPA